MMVRAQGAPRKEGLVSKVAITKPEGAVAISFKHEGESAGVAIGPARWVINIDGEISAENVIDSDIETTIPTMAISPDGTSKVIPPSGFEPEWMPLPEIYRMAHHFGVMVEEG